MTRKLDSGKVITFDDSTQILSNFNGDTLTTFAHGGYGTKLSFDARGQKVRLQLAERTIEEGLFNHTLVGDLSLAQTASDATRTVSGSVTVYHNELKVIATSTLQDIVHTNTCCVPVSGTIITHYASGSNVAPSALGLKLVGKTETMTYRECGLGTLTTASGVQKLVKTGSCL